jgi:microcystin-dependent protein
MGDPFIGEIRMFGGNYAPLGWAFCNGQLLAISTNTALFSVIGTYYGGDGVRTFALPNLQGRVALHQGIGPGLTPYTVGEQGGSEGVQLTLNQIASHNHGAQTASGPPADQARPSNNLPGFSQSGNVYSSASGDSALKAAFVSPAGGNQPHPNVQPFVTFSFIIALQGVFPPHS